MYSILFEIHNITFQNVFHDVFISFTIDQTKPKYCCQTWFSIGTCTTTGVRVHLEESLLRNTVPTVVAPCK